MIDKDLQVFIPNTEMIEESIKQFVEMYSLRTRKSLEGLKFILEGEGKKCTDYFKSGGNILDQSASKQ